MKISRAQRRAPWLPRLGLLTLVLGIGFWGVTYWSRLQADSSNEIETVPVRRTTLSSTVTEDGEVDSSEKTLIQCQLENITFRNAGASISASGRAMIIELMPEGTIVKEGDLLCRLNSAEYEEMVRQQQIELEEDLATYENARLTLETLQIQLREYRDGLFVQQQEQLRGQIAMAEADVQRQQDRLRWSEQMAKIGYLTRSQLTTERNKMLQMEIALTKANLAHKNLVDYTSEKRLIQLQSQIDSAETVLRYRQSRVDRDREDLARYRQQVEYCTIRAPHDGYLIYAKEDDVLVELGATVRQNQDLFYLPDLQQMEVRAQLHESVVSRVRPGQPVRIRVEALRDAYLEGEVVRVAALPVSRRSRSWRQADDIKNYESRIKLHVIPEGLMPGMTAQVEILTDQVPDALVIPPMALTVEGGRSTCYVATEKGVERRTVTTGAYHPQMIQVVAGLSEGEQVVVEPGRLAPDAIIVADEAPALDANAVASLSQPIPTL